MRTRQEREEADDSEVGDDSDSEDEAEIVHKSASGKVYNKDGFEVVPKQKIKKRKHIGNSCTKSVFGFLFISAPFI